MHSAAPEVESPARMLKVELDATAVCSTREGTWELDFCQATACMGARGGGQEATMLIVSRGYSATKLQMVTGHWPHLPGSLSSLALLKNPKSRATCPEKAHNLPLQIGNLPQSWPQQALLPNPNCICHTSLPSPTGKSPGLSCYFRPLVP